MTFTFILAIILLAILLVGCLASVLLAGKGPEEPQSARVPAPLVAVCTVPVAAFVFYLASGYAMLSELLPPQTVSLLGVLLQVVAPLMAGGACFVTYLKRGRKLRFFLMFWVNLVLAAVGIVGWAIL